MTVVITTELNVGYDKFKDVEEVTREVLAEHGFGVLTEIDAKKVLKKKIGVSVRTQTSQVYLYMCVNTEYTRENAKHNIECISRTQRQNG